MTNAENFLRELYFNPQSPASYSNLNKMWREVRSSGRPIKYKEVKLATYQLHKPAIKKFTYRKTMASYAYQQFQADLVDMQKFAVYNDNFNYILTVIDVFSRYAWVLPLKSKRGEDVRDLFEIIFKGGLPEKFSLMKAKSFTTNT